MPVISNAKHANFFRAHLKGTVLIADTLIDVTDVSGLPTLVDSDDFFDLVIHRLNDNAKEIVRVTDVTGTVLTVTRAVQSTTALALEHGDRIELWATSGLLQDLYDEIVDQVDNISYANSAAGIDHGDATIDNSVAKLITDAAGAQISIYLSGTGANGGDFNATTLLNVGGNVTFVFESGAFLSGASWTIGFATPVKIIAPINRIFDSTVTVLGIQGDVYPQWFMDAFGDEITSNDMSAALVSAGDAGELVRLTDLQGPLGNSYAIKANVSINTTVMRFDPGRLDDGINRTTMLEAFAGFTATINAEIQAGQHRIFTGAGLFAGSMKADQYLPQWTGAKGDGIVDDRDAINRLITEIMGSSGTIFFPRGTYLLNDDLTIPAGVNVVMGDGAKFSINVGDILTLNGSLQAGAYEVFDGLGTINGTFSADLVVPQWFSSTVVNLTVNVTTPVGNVSAPQGTLFPFFNKTVNVGELFMKRAGTGSDDWYPMIGQGIQTFTDLDATPDVRAFKTFKTANTGSTTITDFDNGFVGQMITILVEDNDTIFAFSGPNLSGNREFDYPAKIGDTLYAVLNAANVWQCVLTQGAASLAGYDWDSGWTKVEPDVAHDLHDETGEGFSSTSKVDVVTGETNASADLDSIGLIVTVDDPGYRDAIVMIKQRHDVAPAGPRNDYVAFAGSHFQHTRHSGADATENSGFVLYAQGSKIIVQTMPNNVLNGDVLGKPLNNLDWSSFALGANAALMRIKLRKV